MHHCVYTYIRAEKTLNANSGHRGDPAEARGSLSLFSSTLLSGFSAARSARRCAGDTVGSETEAVPPLTCHAPDRRSNASNHGLRRLTALRLRHRVSDRRSRAAYSDDGEDQRPQADSGNGGGSAARRRSAPRCGRGSKVDAAAKNAMIFVANACVMTAMSWKLPIRLQPPAAFRFS